MGNPFVHIELMSTDVDKTKSLGAAVMKDVTEVPNMGSFVIITDPTGGMLGLWETKAG